MPPYPLMFTFRDVVSGNGFLAAITVSGRTLMVKEDDGKWWAYGVRPGAVADCGQTPQEAFHSFRNRYKLVLFDLAEEASSFDSFKEGVESFYSQPDPEEESRWTKAFQAIRAGEVTIEPPFTDLPKEPPEKRPTAITVLSLHQIQQFTAADNIPDLFTCAAAA